MRSRRSTMARLAALLATSVLCACAPKADDGREHIVASFHNMSEPFFVVMRRELLAEAETLGVSVSILDGQANSAKQTADVQAALVQGADAILLAPTDVRALSPAVDAVLREDVPLVTVDRRVEGAAAPVPHVGADNVAGGRKMAEWVMRAYPNGARIVLVTGQPGSSSAIDRTRGIKAALVQGGARYPIVAEQTANWSRDQGLTVVQNILTGLGAAKPDVIISENDDMALGAVEALRSAGVTGVAVLGFDATPEALRRVRDGEMALTVEQSPSRQVRTALRQLVARLRQKTPLQSVSIEPVIITSGNLQDAERISEVR